MGHDIIGYNVNKKEIAYARYSMSDQNANLLYKAFDSEKLNHGVSGNGSMQEFDIDDVNKAVRFLGSLDTGDFVAPGGYTTQEDWGFIKSEIGKITRFIESCRKAAEEDGIVYIFFG